MRKIRSALPHLGLSLWSHSARHAPVWSVSSRVPISFASSGRSIAPPWPGFILEDRFDCKLHRARTVGIGRLQERAGGYIVVDRRPLRVVEDVECLRAEFKMQPLLDGNALEQSHVEVRP